MEIQEESYISIFGKKSLKGIFTGTVWDCIKGEVSVIRHELAPFIGIEEMNLEGFYEIDYYLKAYFQNSTIQNEICDQSADILSDAIRDYKEFIPLSQVPVLIVCAALIGFEPAQDLYLQLDPWSVITLKHNVSVQSYFAGCILPPTLTNKRFSIKNIMENSTINAQYNVEKMMEEESEIFDAYYDDFDEEPD